MEQKAEKEVGNASKLVMRLFVGDDPKDWNKRLDHKGLTTLTLDNSNDSREDLLNDSVFHYLTELAEGGSVSTFLGRPPCRTVSVLRFRQPGPPPVRSREGPERFGFKYLGGRLLEGVQQDTILYLRFLWLYSLAQEASPTKVRFLKESPEDPNAYKKPEDTNEYPSFFSWPEWKGVKEKYGLTEISLDQGPLGHERQKPTRLGTNLNLLKDLQGLRGPGHDAAPLPRGEDSLQRSKRWSAWAPGLKDRIAEAILAVHRDPLVKRLSDAQWRQHVANDHMPYSRHCFECQKGAGNKWEGDHVEENKEAVIRQCTMVQVLPNRTGTVMVTALARMTARLAYLGFPVRRIHSDRAGELGSKTMQRWAEARNIVRTYTAGSDWRSNGRAEAEIGQIRRGVNVILNSTGVSKTHWPMIARHVGERRGRQQLASIGLSTPTLLQPRGCGGNQKT